VNVYGTELHYLAGPRHHEAPGRQLRFAAVTFGETPPSSRRREPARERPAVASGIRALSLWRPWPWLILHLGTVLQDPTKAKNIENRPWRTHYRGLLVLHAGRVIQKDVLNHITDQFGPSAAAATAEGFVGVATLTDVHHADTCNAKCSEWAERQGWHWVIQRPRAFPRPIPGPGRQGLFIPPPTAIAAAEASE
jgi:hypothetical protein